MLNADHIPLLDAHSRQGGRDGGADAGPIFGGPDVDAILLGGGPIEDLAQGLGATGLEVRVAVEDGAVGADVAGVDALLLADGGDAAGREAGGARADQLGQAAAELEFGFRRPDGERVGHEVGGFGEVFVGVSGLEWGVVRWGWWDGFRGARRRCVGRGENLLFDGGEEGGVEGVWFAQLADVLALENVDVLVVVELDEDEAEEFAEVETGDHLFERLLVRAWRVAVDDDVVWGAG